MPKTEIEILLDDLHSNLVVTASRLCKLIDEEGTAKEKAGVVKRLQTLNKNYTALIHAATPDPLHPRQQQLEVEAS